MQRRLNERPMQSVNPYPYRVCSYHSTWGNVEKPRNASDLQLDTVSGPIMATIAVFRSSMMKPSLCRFASTVNSAIFQKYGNPANVLRYFGAEGAVKW